MARKRKYNSRRLLKTIGTRIRQLANKASRLVANQSNQSNDSRRNRKTGKYKTVDLGDNILRTKAGAARTIEEAISNSDLSNIQRTALQDLILGQPEAGIPGITLEEANNQEFTDTIARYISWWEDEYLFEDGIGLESRDTQMISALKNTRGLFDSESLILGRTDRITL